MAILGPGNTVVFFEFGPHFGICQTATAAAARSRKSNLTLRTIFGSYKAYNPGSITCAVRPLEDRIVMLLLGATMRDLADTDDPQAQRGLCIVTDALMS